MFSGALQAGIAPRPDFSILGPEEDHYGRLLAFENSQLRRRGMGRLSRYAENRRYAYGEQEDPSDVRQPLGINYVRTLHTKKVRYLFGEWERDVVDWSVVPALGDAADDEAAKIQQALYHLFRRADANDKLMRAAWNASVYGDAILRTHFKPRVAAGGGAYFESVLPENYHALWSPLDVAETLECCLAYNLDRRTVQRQFGTPGAVNRFSPQAIAIDPTLAVVWEYWSQDEWLLVVDDVFVKGGPNPYRDTPTGPGFLPFVHIPNLPVDGEYFGFGDCEPIFLLQDELNERAADLGDIVNYHAHPIILLKNFWGKVRELISAPDAVWEMGREGDAEYLQWDGPPPEVLNYLMLVMQFMLDTSNLTPVAFGRSEQSQASGFAMNLAMLPVTEVVRRQRAVWGPRLRDQATSLLAVEAYGLGRDAFVARYGFAPEAVARYEIMPRFAPILPRDRLAVVNEQVARLVNKAQTIVGALEEFGEDNPVKVYERILQEQRELNAVAAELIEETAKIEARYGVKIGAVAETANRSGGKNSDRATGGSNADGA